jgi:hypothetical protein
MGEVYSALDTRLEREVAVKLVSFVASTTPGSMTDGLTW